MIKALDPKELLLRLHQFSTYEPADRRTPKNDKTSLTILYLNELEDALEGLCIALSAV
jgi:hypothetical protein